MGSIVKQSSIGLIANYIGIFVGFVNVMLIMPSLLKAEQIGLINLILSVVMIVSPIMDFSATQIIGRYFTHVKHRQEILNLSFVISCCGALFFILIFIAGQPWFIRYYQKNSPEIIPYYWWIYMISIIMSWTSLAECFSIINSKYHISAFSREVLFRLGITGLLSGLALHLYDFNTYIYLHFLMYGVSGVIILFYLRNKGLFRWRLTLPSLSAGQRRSMFRFGGFTIFTGLAAVTAGRMDMIMLGSMEGLKDVGVYTIAMFMASTIEIPRKSVLQSSAPVIRMAIRENDFDKVAQIQYKTILNLLLIGGFILTILMANLNSIYAVIPNGGVYRTGFWVVLFIGLSRICDMLAGSNDEIIISSRYYRFNVVFIILLASLSIGLNYKLIPAYGLTGAAASTFLATGIVVFFKSWLFRVLFKRNVYNLTLPGIMLFYIILGSFFYFVPDIIHPIISIGIKCMLIALCLFLFLKWTRVSPDLNQLINQMLGYIKIDRWIRI